MAHLHFHTEGMLVIAETFLAVKLVTALAYDFT